MKQRTINKRAVRWGRIYPKMVKHLKGCVICRSDGTIGIACRKLWRWQKREAAACLKR